MKRRDDVNKIYTDRENLSDAQWQKLVDLCLARRRVVTAENKDELFERDQRVIEELV